KLTRALHSWRIRWGNLGRGRAWERCYLCAVCRVSLRAGAGFCGDAHSGTDADAGRDLLAAARVHVARARRDPRHLGAEADGALRPEADPLERGGARAGAVPVVGG